MRSKSRIRRTLGVVILVMSALFIWPVSAQAHTDLLGSTPREGDTVSVAVDQLVLVFAEADLSPDTADVVVRDRAGRDVTVGALSTQGDSVTVALSMTEPGVHEVGYRVIGEDGHPVVGAFIFTAKAAPPGPGPTTPLPPTAVADADVVPAAAGTNGQGQPLDPRWWVAGLVALGGVALLHRRRRRTG